MLLSVAYGSFVDRLHTHMAEVGYVGFSTRTGFVLRVLGDEALSLRELADRLEMSSPAALKITDAMVRDGFAERVPSPADRRVRAVRATPLGHAALAEARRLHASIEHELVAAIGADEAAAVRRGLEAIAGRATEAIPQVLRRAPAEP